MIILVVGPNNVPRTASVASPETKQPFGCMASHFIDPREGTDFCR